MHNVLVFAFSVSATPKPGPIDKPLQELLNMLVATGLIAAAIGFVTGGVMSVVGGSGGNYGIAARGKRLRPLAHESKQGIERSGEQAEVVARPGLFPGAKRL